MSKLFPFVLILCFLLTACDSGGSEDNGPSADDPSSLIGSWDLVSVQDKLGELYDLPGTTLTAGEPYTFEANLPTGQVLTLTITVDGVLTLQSSRYAVTLTSAYTLEGSALETETDTDTGTWSIVANTMVFSSDDPDEDVPTFLTLGVNGNTMTLEDDEVRMVLEKQ